MAETKQTEIWIQKAREGDSLAVSKLLAKYHATLRARVIARMDQAIKAKLEPEDILQDVYLNVFRSIDRFEARGPGGFLSWVLTIADNALVDARRAVHSQRRDIAREIRPPAAGKSESYWNLLDQLYADSVTPSRVVRCDEAVGALLACISRLPDSQRQVLEMRFLEGCPVSEVASRLNKSEDAVVAATQYALKALRTSMDRLGEFTHGS